uniref:Uncharacterized protein n=1 Tax=Rhizophora mucronata TaxID=61149 RepID=A0A2P2N5N5_RHIMU
MTGMGNFLLCRH